MKVSFPNGRIVWNYFGGPVTSDQWAVQLNRHEFWLQLAAAYKASGQARYARAFAAQLRSWLDDKVRLDWRTQRVPYVDGAYESASRCELALSSGYRMSDVWWIVYDAFKQDPEFTPALQLRMLAAMARHAKFLAKASNFSASTNHGIFQTDGLQHVAAFLPEHSEAPAWADLAILRYAQMAKEQVDANGIQHEYAPSYHIGVVRAFLRALEIERARGQASVAAVESLAAVTKKAIAATMMTAIPYRMPGFNSVNYALPDLNDSGWARVSDVVQRASALFPDSEQFKRFVRRDAAAWTAPVTPDDQIGASVQHLPAVGWTTMRTGWSKADSALFFESGPYGRSHQHEDQLNLIVSVGGEPILGEAGKHDYDASEWYAYAASSFGHNVINVDGLGQNRLTRPATWGPGSARTDFVQDPQLDLVAGTYASGFGPKNSVPVVHDRQVLFLKPHYWLVIDTLVAEDNKSHKYQALFNLDAPSVRLDPSTQAFLAERPSAGPKPARLAVIPAAMHAIKPQLFSGFFGESGSSLDTRLPRYIRGYAASDKAMDIGGKSAFKRPVGAASYVWSDSRPISIAAWLLAPDMQGQSMPVVYDKSSNASGTSLFVKVATADGGRDGVSVRATPSPIGTQITTRVQRKPPGKNWGQVFETKRQIGKTTK